MNAELDDVVDTVAASPWTAWIAMVVAVVASVGLALLLSFVFSRVAAALEPRHRVFGELRARFTRPLFWILAVVGMWATVPRLFPDGWAPLADAIEYGLRLCVIGIVGWILAKVLIFLVDGAMVRQDNVAMDAFTARRRRTQIRMIRRLVIAVVVVLTVAAMLLTIPGAQTFGASLLASAGVASIVAGLAAQSTLGNLIAGMQLAFSNALKVGDTVEVGGEFGTVEEITLTYVVVQIWDDRRLVLPSTYFTTTPYTNWTRNQTALTGTVFVEGDYTIDVDAVRAELMRILDGAPEWDRRGGALIMSDAVGGVAQLRATMTAADADDLWTLRCLVREKLVAFIARQRPDELPRRRSLVEAWGDERGVDG